MYHKILKKNGLLILKTDDHKLFDYSYEEIKSSKFNIEDYTIDLYNSSKFEFYKKIKTKYENRFLLEGKKIKLLISSK